MPNLVNNLPLETGLTAPISPASPSLESIATMATVSGSRIAEDMISDTRGDGTLVFRVRSVIMSKTFLMAAFGFGLLITDNCSTVSFACGEFASLKRGKDASCLMKVDGNMTLKPIFCFFCCCCCSNGSWLFKFVAAEESAKSDGCSGIISFLLDFSALLDAVVAVLAAFLLLAAFALSDGMLISSISFAVPMIANFLWWNHTVALKLLSPSPPAPVGDFDIALASDVRLLVASVALLVTL